MRYRRLLVAMLVFPATVWAAEPKPDEVVNNPPFAIWSAFAPGTTVTQKETVKLPDGTRIEIDKTIKLLEKTKDKVVLEAVVKDSIGGTAESETTVTAFPAKVKRSDVDTPRDSLASFTEGKEQVDVKGKKVEAEWVEVSSTSGGETTTEKTWSVRDVPGGVVKQTIVRKKGDKIVSESLLELVEFK